MKITLDEHGIALPDAEVEKYVKNALRYQLDMHVSNSLVIYAARAMLLQMKVADRPEITWECYDKEVHFDKDLRSEDAWNDPRSDLYSEYLHVICSGGRA